MAVIFEEAVIVSAGVPFNFGGCQYGDHITNNKLIITFDGTPYPCDLHHLESEAASTSIYGGFSTSGATFEEYPFALDSSYIKAGDYTVNYLYAETVGTHTIKVEAFEKTVNKVVFGTETLIDLTSDSVTPETLLKGHIAHDRAGALIMGSVPNGNNLEYGLTDATSALIGVGEVGSMIIE